MRSLPVGCLVWSLVFALSSGSLASDVDSTATLQLDADSHISFSPAETFHLPAGSAIRFRFGAPNADGSIPITILPEDVSIAPIAVAQGAALAYSLASPATGTLRRGSQGGEVELVAALVATLRGRPEVSPVTHEIRFTSGRAEASDAAARDSVVVQGTPIAAAGRTIRLVGAATNAGDAFPGAGQAVYAVLSGAFDELPELHTR